MKGRIFFDLWRSGLGLLSVRTVISTLGLFCPWCTRHSHHKSGCITYIYDTENFTNKIIYLINLYIKFSFKCVITQKVDTEFIDSGAFYWVIYINTFNKIEFKDSIPNSILLHSNGIDNKCASLMDLSGMSVVKSKVWLTVINLQLKLFKAD